MKLIKTTFFFVIGAISFLVLLGTIMTVSQGEHHPVLFWRCGSPGLCFVAALPSIIIASIGPVLVLRGLLKK